MYIVYFTDVFVGVHAMVILVMSQQRTLLLVIPYLVFIIHIII